jgi:AcrR family transcriptional regulator
MDILRHLSGKSSGAAREDRRVRRTRDSLAAAMMELMVRKRFDRITVQDLLDQANVGRSTFYTHWRSKEDLLLTHFDRMLEHTVGGEHDDPEGLPTLGLILHIGEQHRLYRALVWGRSAEMILRRAEDYLSARFLKDLARLSGDGDPAVPVEEVARFAASAFLAQLRWWLDSEMPIPAVELDRRFHALVMPGVRAALSSPPPAAERAGTG